MTEEDQIARAIQESLSDPIPSGSAANSSSGTATSHNVFVSPNGRKVKVDQPVDAARPSEPLFPESEIDTRVKVEVRRRMLDWEKTNLYDAKIGGQLPMSTVLGYYGAEYAEEYMQEGKEQA
ncbi:unnamed protein product, partial [Amoebophrya sp. A25]|eukprot:GSA25T00025980001.1